MFKVQIGKNPKSVFIPGLETNFVVQAPIMDDKNLSMRCNAAILQNFGNCDVQLGGGFTLAPNQTIQMGNYNEINTMKIDLSVQFLTATATGTPVVKKLEIIEVYTSIEGRGVYIDQNI